MDPQLSNQLQNYLSTGQSDLVSEGFNVLNYIEDHPEKQFNDYSFVVFPFAKAFEGFLKQALLDKRLIDEHDYFSTHFRLGKVMSPNMIDKLGDRSVYQKICDRYNCQIGDVIWKTWKSGRNEIFHYFPHNLRSITFPEAKEVINQIISTMELVCKEFNLTKFKKTPNNSQ